MHQHRCKNLNRIRYADDTGFMADRKEKLKILQMKSSIIALQQQGQVRDERKKCHAHDMKA